MKRFVLPSFVAVNLILALAAAVLWLRTLWTADSFIVERRWWEDDTIVAQHVSLETGRARFALLWGRWEAIPARRRAPGRHHHDST